MPDGVSINGRFEAERPPTSNWATFGWASCMIDTFVPLVLHWTLLSSLSYNQAYGSLFGSKTSQVHQAHIALSGPMTSIDQQGSTFSSPNPHFNPTFRSLILCRVLSSGRQQQITNTYLAQLPCFLAEPPGFRAESDIQNQCHIRGCMAPNFGWATIGLANCIDCTA